MSPQLPQNTLLSMIEDTRLDKARKAERDRRAAEWREKQERREAEKQADFEEAMQTEIVEVPRRVLDAILSAADSYGLSDDYHIYERWLTEHGAS